MSYASSGLIRGHGLGVGVRPVPSATLSNVRLSYVPLPIALLLVAMLVPGELDFSVGELRLSAHRLVLIVFLPIAITHLLSGRGPALRSFDLVFLAAYAYYALTMFFKEQFGQAIQSGGIIFVEAAGAYLMARTYVRNAHQFLATVKLLFLMVLFVGALAIPESILSSTIAHNAASAISGVPPMLGGGSRMGLLRAMAVFDHPILYGTFCMSVFSLVWFTEPNPVKRVFRALLVAVAAFFSLSSAPLLGVLLVLVGIFWERVTRNIPNRAWLTIAGITVVYLLLSLMANRPPIKVFATTFVLDPSTAWYRTLIWDFGVANVMNHPWIGQPLGVWDRPSWMPSNSVDNFWLATALWGGLPAAVLLGFSIVLLSRAVHRGTARFQHPEQRRCRYAWTATVLALCMVGTTVHYWGTMAVLFAFYVGLGAWLTEPHHKFGRRLGTHVGMAAPSPASP